MRHIPPRTIVLGGKSQSKRKVEDLLRKVTLLAILFTQLEPSYNVVHDDPGAK